MKREELRRFAQSLMDLSGWNDDSPVDTARALGILAELNERSRAERDADLVSTIAEAVAKRLEKPVP